VRALPADLDEGLGRRGRARRPDARQTWATRMLGQPLSRPKTWMTRSTTRPGTWHRGGGAR
jgi:hypothetical protein